MGHPSPARPRVSTACLGQAHRVDARLGRGGQEDGLAYDSRAKME